jgi:hypothetical protein
MVPQYRSMVQQSFLLVGVIIGAAAIGWVVSHGAWAAIVVAAVVAIAALVPPLWFEFCLGRSVAAPTAVVAWRLGVLLPAVLFSASQAEPTRKCFQYTLLACYFIALPLESWLLSRYTRP